MAHSASKYGATVDQLAINKPAAKAMPRTMSPTGDIIVTALKSFVAIMAPITATRSTPKASAAPNTPRITPGCAAANLDTSEIAGPT
ncbi:hypothetical protein D3C72_2213420 [compost metagenome]